MCIAPVIAGRSVRLRPHRIEDLDAFAPFFRSPRAAMMDVPETRTDLWYMFMAETGSWALTGMGGWAIETADGALAGQVALLKPPHFAETELGWFLLDGFEGRGLAFEAASLALSHARTQLRPASLVSYIDPVNNRSIDLARRLGATRDDAAPRHDPGDLVYRHAVAA